MEDDHGSRGCPVHGGGNISSGVANDKDQTALVQVIMKVQGFDEPELRRGMDEDGGEGSFWWGEGRDLAGQQQRGQLSLKLFIPLDTNFNRATDLLSFFLLLL